MDTWTVLNNTGMLFGGRGFGCSFVRNSTDAYVIMAGGNKGNDKSQVWNVQEFLLSEDVSALGNWTAGPDMPTDMVDSAVYTFTDGSMVMFGSKTGKNVRCAISNG